MKIVADENIDRGIVDRLPAEGHDVLYIAEVEPGIDDPGVLGRSLQTDSACCIPESFSCDWLVSGRS